MSEHNSTPSMGTLWHPTWLVQMVPIKIPQKFIRLGQRDQIWFRDWLQQRHEESSVHLDTKVRCSAEGFTILSISNSPMNHKANWESTWRRSSFKDNQAFWPGWKGGAVDLHCFACFLVCREEHRRVAQTCFYTPLQHRKLACMESTATLSSWKSNKGGWTRIADWNAAENLFNKKYLLIE